MEQGTGTSPKTPEAKRSGPRATLSAPAGPRAGGSCPCLTGEVFPSMGRCGAGLGSELRHSHPSVRSAAPSQVRGDGAGSVWRAGSYVSASARRETSRTCRPAPPLPLSQLLQARRAKQLPLLPKRNWPRPQARVLVRAGPGGAQMPTGHPRHRALPPAPCSFPAAACPILPPHASTPLLPWLSTASTGWGQEGMHSPSKNPLLRPSDQAVRMPCCKGHEMPSCFSQVFFTHLLVERCAQIVHGKSNGLRFPLWVQAWRCFGLPRTHIWGKQEHKIWMEGKKTQQSGVLPDVQVGPG